MTHLDAKLIRQFTSDAARNNLTRLDVLAEIDSTNSYLMQRPGPEPGKMCVVVTSNQTAGRGRHGKDWQSPPGSGLCLSAAYTFVARPRNLPALTLAIGLSAVRALQELGVDDAKIKWPNDLVVRNAKFGGILTEVQPQSAEAPTVVTGIGINIDTEYSLDKSTLMDSALPVIDLKRACPLLPVREEFAGAIVSQLYSAFAEYDAHGFIPFAPRWPQHDWLLGRQVAVEVGDGQVAGVASGIAEDGALLVETANGAKRITSGSVVSVGPGATAA